jgi:hypothetical protein
VISGKLSHIVFGHPTTTTTEYRVAIFINNNNYICHLVHIELRVSAAAATAAFSASLSGELLAC